MGLFSEEELNDMYRKHAGDPRGRDRLDGTRQKTKAEHLIEVARDYPDATIAELAEAAEMSAVWVRKHLRSAGYEIVSVPRVKAGEEEADRNR